MQVLNMASFTVCKLLSKFPSGYAEYSPLRGQSLSREKKRLKLSKFVSHCNFCGLFSRKYFCMKECYEKVR